MWVSQKVSGMYFFFKDTILFNPIQLDQFSTQSHLFLMHLVHRAPGTSMCSKQYSQHNKIQNKPFQVLSASPTFVFQISSPLKGF